MQLQTTTNDTIVTAALVRTAVRKSPESHKLPMHLGYIGDKLIAFPIKQEDSTQITQKIDGYLNFPEGFERYSAGSLVNIELCRPAENFQNTLVVIGSHDPLMGIVSNYLAQNQSAYSLAASHVGSMGGLMAIRRGEAHIAGIHLLNEKDGTYNTSFIKKHFPEGGVRVVECVGRVQGIMTAHGNPKNITDISSLKNADIRYLNRQKGSGTRILFDYLLKKNELSPSDICGYKDEEFTHTEIACKIANGLADAGMGIYSAAAIYGLDFIPICNEQYDLLISDSAWETEMVQEFISILKSKEFAKKLTEMGGYTLEHPGEVRYHL